MKKLFAGDLWPLFTTSSGNDRLKNLENNFTDPLETLIESLILYDKIVVPTQDFIVIPAFISALGEDSFRSLIECGAIEFLRLNRIIGFESGKGAALFKLQKREGQPHPFAADLDWVIDWAVKAFVPTQDPKCLISAISNTVTEIEEDGIHPVLRKESEDDILESEETRELFSLPKIHPRDFSVEENKVIFYSNSGQDSSFQTVNSYLRLVQTNVELYMSNWIGCDDIASAANLDSILTNKHLRSQHKEAMSNLMEINRIPDFAPNVRNGTIPLHQIIKLRDSKHCGGFRTWFHENINSASTKEIAQNYIDLLSSTSVFEKIPNKILRVIVWTSASTAAGLVAAGPVGTAVGAAVGFSGGLFDAFVMDKLGTKGSPKVFLDKLRHLK